ncbi:MAG TPA: Flp family type IVb pilin [Eoetvoesiella sp.]
MRKFIKLFMRDERGVSALEYAILAGLIVAAVSAAVALLDTSLFTAFTNLSTSITTATTP